VLPVGSYQYRLLHETVCSMIEEIREAIRDLVNFSSQPQIHQRRIGSLFFPPFGSLLDYDEYYLRRVSCP
jgi:hypothetical protein